MAGKHMFLCTVAVLVAVLFVASPVFAAEEDMVLNPVIEADDSVAIESEEVPMAGGSMPTIKKPTASSGAPAADTPTYNSSSPVIDVSTADKGYIYVAYKTSVTHKIGIKTGSSSISYITLNGNGSAQKVYLTEGSGSYTIILYKNVGGDRYVVVTSKTCSYTEKTSSAVPAGVDSRFLKPSNEINYDESPKSVSKAEDLIKKTNKTKDQASKLYSYVVQSVRYDYSVLNKLPAGYLPDMDRTYTSHKGICYDFSALLGGMLRSQGIPAKLVKGTAKSVKGYHAWNEIYIDGKWYVIDSSSDSILHNGNKKASMYKSSSDYHTQKTS